jgi:hypothetical protein
MAADAALASIIASACPARYAKPPWRQAVRRRGRRGAPPMEGPSLVHGPSAGHDQGCSVPHMWYRPRLTTSWPSLSGHRRQAVWTRRDEVWVRASLAVPGSPELSESADRTIWRRISAISGRCTATCGSPKRSRSFVRRGKYKVATTNTGACAQTSGRSRAQRPRRTVASLVCGFSALAPLHAEYPLSLRIQAR